MNPVAITLRQLAAAHKEFERSEPRDLFYRVAIELIDLSLRGETQVTLPEALAVLLQTWNKALYRFHPFDDKHFAKIEAAVEDNRRILLAFRERSIDDFDSKDEPAVERLFSHFEEVLGPVGAAKSIHLLAPRFFPIWDREIAKAYGVPLKAKGRNVVGYIRFMAQAKEQVERLGGEAAVGRNPLKAIDEYNYCEYTKKHWKSP